MTTNEPLKTKQPTHPVYLKAARGEYVDFKDIATLIRSALKKTFPLTKFSVKTKTYSGGGSVSVYYTDGPAMEHVRRIAENYQTKHFDGMIDLAYGSDLWIYPDGSVSLAHSEGTEGSMGVYAETIDDPKSADAVLLDNAAHAYVHVNRNVSAKQMRRVIEMVKELNYSDLEDVNWDSIEVEDGYYGARINGAGHIRFGNTYLEHELWSRALKLNAAA